MGLVWANAANAVDYVWWGDYNNSTEWNDINNWRIISNPLSSNQASDWVITAAANVPFMAEGVTNDLVYACNLDTDVRVAGGSPLPETPYADVPLFPTWKQITIDINTSFTAGTADAGYRMRLSAEGPNTKVACLNTTLNINAPITMTSDSSFSRGDFNHITVNQYENFTETGGTFDVVYKGSTQYNVLDGSTLQAPKIRVYSDSAFANPASATGGVDHSVYAKAELNVFDGGTAQTNILDIERVALHNGTYGRIQLFGTGRLVLTGDQTALVATLIEHGRLWGNDDTGLAPGATATQGMVAYELVGGNTVVTAIPEPATMILLGLGSVLAIRRRK